MRVRGGNKKYRALRLDVGNFSWGSECKYVLSLLCRRETCAGLQDCCRVKGCKHGLNILELAAEAACMVMMITLTLCGLRGLGFPLSSQ